MKKLVCGVGVNDTDTPTQTCSYYGRWKNMLKRCYDKRYMTKHPTYKDCSVCDDWLIYSNFKAWLISQEQFHGSLVDLQLDKDIIDPTNKVYSPDKCAFVGRLINSFVTDAGAIRGDYPLGVGKRSDGRFRSRCGNPFKKNQLCLGNFLTAEEAHEAWRKQKHIFACQLASTVKDPRVADALRVRYK